MHYHKNDHGNLPEREATPEALYASRREWLERAGLAAVGLIGTSFVGQALAGSAGKKVERAPLKFAKDANPPKETLTPLEAVSSYNNFYEFGFGKSDPAQNAGVCALHHGPSRSAARSPSRRPSMSRNS
ncbi:hypothetical protein [Hankyongella ginsenosidimutans]|uniref:hypothetical protein n=1 Tax=Hankyongella ginsenosidimutans TaxID=1763828 RepID=UPI001FEA3251|nr:hypothetical protein [Hankyongella ginsenosidimutans]